MTYDPNMYNAKFYRGRKKKHPHYRKLMESLVELCGPFESVLDLGAGDGFCAAVLSESGAEPYMVEISEAVHHYTCARDKMRVKIHDLREPLDYGRTFDLVLCIEVAEHLPESAADTLCDTIARHVGRLLIFTSAPPRQVGDGHVNLQPKEYWAERFRARGLVYKRGKTKKLQAAWNKALQKKGFQHLAANLQVWGR